jgi:hypothetical protein
MSHVVDEVAKVPIVVAAPVVAVHHETAGSDAQGLILFEE